MTASRVYYRDLLGLILIVSCIFVVIAVQLDLMAILAHLTHDDAIANLFFHESIPLFVFAIPPYFIARYINQKKWVLESQAYRLQMSKEEG